VQTAEGKLYLLVAIDRTSKFAIVELHEKATMRVAADFLRALVQAVPYKALAVTELQFYSPIQIGAALRTRIPEN
jgi:hypothetical protein